MQMKALWVQVIKGKYGEEEGGWSSCIPREGYGVGMWKDLRKSGHLVNKKMFFVVVDGQRIKFWGIDGVGIPLYVMLFCLFLSLLSLAKEAWGGGGGGGGGGGDFWSAE